MAIKNYIATDTYSVVDNIRLDRANKTLDFSLTVYADSSKETEETKQEYTVDGHTGTPPSVEAVVDANPTEVDGDVDVATIPVYLSSSKHADPGCLLTCSEGGGKNYDYDDGAAVGTEPNSSTWVWQPLSATEEYYKDKAGQHWYVPHDKGTVTKCSAPFTASDFDTWFSVATINEDDTNLVKQIYLYIKSLSLFANVKDA